MKYLLDTNICIYIIKKKPPNVLKKFSKIKAGTIAISSMTAAELYYGIFKSTKPNENTIALEQFMAPLAILDFNKDDSFTYGKIRADLEEKGKVIGAMDLLIAAQALNRNLVLVTNNQKEFARIENLTIENWI